MLRFTNRPFFAPPLYFLKFSMGKSLPSPATKLHAIARSASLSTRSSRTTRPASEIVLRRPDAPTGATTGRRGGERRMEGAAVEEGRQTPLAEVVEDCVKRWFKDTLREAKAGDLAMQVLVGQMYVNGYGVPKNPQKSVYLAVLRAFVAMAVGIYLGFLGMHQGKAWIRKASKFRLAAWKVYDKPPGYTASESDSDAMRGDLK
ncbi:hypothetical protein QJS10_CPB21g01475 [Acorus calamus]|uniref:Uncharacterized protein n=1 Tax=Acorus calamus TaxID=4465 RepID=A0AAV9C565_ACOCL|nr:hypothetical protein QJS10_CPB21g01475 [Acorus calamus]